MWTCKHCLGIFIFAQRTQKANHSRWCKDNPNYSNIRKRASELTKNATEACVGRKLSEETRNKLSVAHTGKHKGSLNNFYGKVHSTESKEKISKAGRESNHRRLVRSTREYLSVSGKVILLDSSWEEELAKQLDRIAVIWERPETPLEWVDSKNKIRKYFPDFYLPKYNVFLDPKNSAAYKNQEEKINWLRNNRKDIIFLKTLDECKNFRPWSN